MHHTGTVYRMQHATLSHARLGRSVQQEMNPADRTPADSLNDKPEPEPEPKPNPIPILHAKSPNPNPIANPNPSPDSAMDLIL